MRPPLVLMSLELRQRQDDRVGDPAPRLEGRQEPPLHFGVDLGLRGAFGVFLDLLPQVLVAREDPGLVLPLVQVPAFGPELVEGVVEFDRASDAVRRGSRRSAAG